jgi:pimeloyl-ACP methyl ester carboxylesterase
MPTVQVGDVEIGYESFGSGPPLLFIMGVTASRHHWLGFHERFADRFRVIAFDNRGVGASRTESPPSSIAQMAEDALGLLDALSIPRAHVCGVSMGGMIAQELALAAPTRVDRLVLGCTTPGGANQILPGGDVIDAFRRVGTQSPEATIRELLAINFTPAFMATHPELIEGLVTHGLGARIAPAVFMGQSNSIVQHDTEARCGSIAAPTLVITGDVDRVIPGDNSRTLAARIPRAKLAILEGIAHMFWIEAPDAAEAAIRAHLG